MIKKLCFSAVVLLLASSAVVCLAAAEPIATNTFKPVANLNALFDDPVVVRGKGVEVKKSQLEEAFTAFAANLAARGQNLSEDLRVVREAQLLDRLVITRLLVNRAVSADQTRAKELADKFVAEARKAANSEESFRRQLKAAGMSEEGFTNRVMEQALAEAVIERELKPKVTVSDAQVEEFYKTGTDLLVKEMEADIGAMGKNPKTTIGDLADARAQLEEFKNRNLARLELPEKVRVAHILISTRDTNTDQDLKPEQKKVKRQVAEKALTRARAGEDFAKLVKEFSDDKSSTNGEYILSRQDPFVPEFRAAAFSLATNQISDIVTTAYGYHILKSFERMPAKKLEFAKVAPQLKEALIQQALQKKMPDYFAEVKKEAALEVLDPKYKIPLPKATDSIRPPS